MPPSTNKVVIRSLYRSLLRVSAPFSAPSPSAATYASLLHRSGVSHDWEACVYQSDRRRGAALREKKKKERIEKSGKGESASIPKSWAKNLAKSYTDLQMEYESKRGIFEEDEEEFWDDDEGNLDLLYEFRRESCLLILILFCTFMYSYNHFSDVYIIMIEAALVMAMSTER